MDVFIETLNNFRERDRIGVSGDGSARLELVGHMAARSPVTVDMLKRYLGALLYAGVFENEPEPLELNKAVLELTGNTAPLSDCAITIQEFYSDSNEVARPTARHSVSEEEDSSEKRSPLTSIWERADEVMKASKGGRPAEGHVKRAVTRIRLDPANVEWLKSKGPNHLSRINGLLTALRENEENHPFPPTAD